MWEDLSLCVGSFNANRFLRNRLEKLAFSTYLHQYLTVPESPCFYRQYIKKIYVYHFRVWLLESSLNMKDMTYRPTYSASNPLECLLPEPYLVNENAMMSRQVISNECQNLISNG